MKLAPDFKPFRGYVQYFKFGHSSVSGRRETSEPDYWVSTWADVICGSAYEESRATSAALWVCASLEGMVDGN